MKKRNWKFILPPPVLAAFLFMACNLIQEMPKDFVETYGNIAYVESVEYVGLAEEGGDKPKVTETKNFKIIYHIKNDGDFDLSPEFSFEGCEIKNPHVDTGKKRVSLTIAGEELKALDNGKEFKVKLTLYKASQKVLQSQYEIGMLYVDTVGSEISTGTVGMKVEVLDGYTLEEIDGEDKDKFKFVQNGDGSYTITTEEGGVPEGKYELELVVKDKETGEEVIIKKEIEVSTGGFVGDDEPFEITAEMIEKAKKNVVYVRGTGAGWYTEHPDFTALEGNDTTGEGTREKPFATIQKAVDTIIARNAADDSEPYTIYVDGTLTQSAAANANGMADFSELDKNLKLTIKSLSDTKATLDAREESRVIYAKPASGILNLTLENLVITGGNVSGVGGGISFNSNDGTLEIKNSTISKNTVPSHGGGIHISGKSTFKMNGCTISENIANGNNFGNGAGIYVENGVNATISNTTLSKNEANPNGGAIYAGNNCNLTTENCTISGNSAQQNGGGVYVIGSTLEMKGGTIGGTRDDDKNTAKLGGGVYISGNGTFIMNYGTTTECSITGNTAKNGGGGVFISGSTFEMNGGTINGNEAKDSNGGGVYVYASGTFTMSGGNIGGNTATKDGGGVYVTDSKFTMTGGSTIGGENAEDGNNAKYGGGVYISGNGTFIMNYGKISSNKAEGEADSGGGGVNVFSGKFEMKDGTISKNEANGSEFGGGGVYVHTGQEFTMRGGTISGNAANHDGGGIYSKNGNFTMSGGKIVDKNTAKYGGGVYVMAGANTFMMSNGEISNNEASEQGGGVYVNSTTFSMSGTAKISGNKAAKSGGGIYVYKDPDNSTDAIFTMACSVEGEISGNTAQNGGGIYNQGGTPTIYSGTISGNKAEGDTYSGGGGVYNQGGTFKMEGGTISGNIATANGGGVYTQGGAFTMIDGTIGGNKAESGNGGGVCVYDSSTFEMIGGGINMNTAEKGNGVYVTKVYTVMDANFKKFTIGGGAKFNKKDDVYLEVQNPSPGVSLQRIHIISPLGEDFFVTITPERYESDKPVLSAGGSITEITQSICDKFAVTQQANGTKWKIAPSSDKKYGVLKKDTVSSGEGISVTVPDLGTYRVVVMSNGNQIKDGEELPSNNDISIDVKDLNGNSVEGTFKSEIQDRSGIKIDEGTKTLHTPSYSFELDAQIYVKVELNDGTVIKETILVTIKPNS